MALARLLAAAVVAAALTLSGARAQSLTTSLSRTTIVETIPIPLPTGSASHTSTSYSTTSVITSVPITFAVSTTPTTSSTTPNPSSPPPTPSQSQGPTLDTHVDPAFGVLGAILILTGIPSAFWGHKNRWSSFFIIGFYTLALVTISLILKFGVLTAVNPPSQTLRGLFVLSCVVAGVAGGGIAIFFWKGAKFFIGAWGGFAFGLWVQCFRNGGLVRPIGFRWLFYIGLATVGFVSCTVPKWHWHVMLISTSIVGATAFILGVDCFASSGLKEFYIYNLGFSALFPKFASTHFPLNQVMEILLGLIAAVAVMGMSVQLRILVVLRRKLKEIGAEEQKREAEAEAKAAERFVTVQADMDRWEKEHGRNPSNFSGTPLLAGEPSTPGQMTAARNSSQFSLPYVGARTRHSALSGDATAFGADSPDPTRLQSPGAIPALDLGAYDIESGIPKDFVAEDAGPGLTDAELQQKADLLAEIQSIRKSIDVLRSATASPRASIAFTDDGRQRLQSFSQSLNGMEGRTRFDSSASRSPTQERARVHSMDVFHEGSSTVPGRHVRTLSSPMAPPARGTVTPDPAEYARSILRPNSTPLRDNWDAYTQERTLFVPPSGKTVPIASSPVPVVSSPQPQRNSLFAIPASVTDALMRRQKRESAYLGTGFVEVASVAKDIEMGRLPGRESYVQGGTNSNSHSSDNVAGVRPSHRKTGSFTTVARQGTGTSLQPPITILPPVRNSATAEAAHAAQIPRTHTFEELTARHREKMRTLQDPVSRVEREQADLEAARSRWERSKTIERDVMAKRESEAQAKLTREQKERGRQTKTEGRRASRDVTPPAPVVPRGSNTDKLGTPSRRMSSALKVQEWQRFQREGAGQTSTPVGTATQRSVASPPANVPFPGGKPAPEKRRSKTADLFLRSGRADPPS